MSNFPSEPTDRRNFCRLDDHIIFDYCVLEDGESPEQQIEFDPMLKLQNIGREIRDINQDLQPHLQTVSNQSHSIGEALRCLNKKIDSIHHFLSQELLAKFILKIDTRETQYVNISAGGLAFSSDKSLTPKQRLFCKIILKPKLDCILTTAEVVACNQQKNDKIYRVSVKFIELPPSDEQIITRYIFKQQIQARQQSKILE